MERYGVDLRFGPKVYAHLRLNFLAVDSDFEDAALLGEIGYPDAIRKFMQEKFSKGSDYYSKQVRMYFQPALLTTPPRLFSPAKAATKKFPVDFDPMEDYRVL